MKIIPSTDLHAISAAHGGTILMTVLAVPHLVMGVKEFTDWSVNMYRNGPEEGDVLGGAIYDFFAVKEPVKGR